MTCSCSFNPSHSSDLTDLENDIYYLPHPNFASCEDFDFNEKLNNEKTLERNAFPFVVRDPTLHHGETFHEGNSWTMLPNFHISKESTLVNFASPTMWLKTIVIAITQ